MILEDFLFGIAQGIGKRIREVTQFEIRIITLSTGNKRQVVESARIQMDENGKQHILVVLKEE